MFYQAELGGTPPRQTAATMPRPATTPSRPYLLGDRIYSKNETAQEVETLQPELDTSKYTEQQSLPKTIHVSHGLPHNVMEFRLAFFLVDFGPLCEL